MENLNLPQEIKNNVLQYLPRDKDMTSKLSEFIVDCDELKTFKKLKWEIDNQSIIFEEEEVPEEERVYDDPDMTYYEYYFKHDFNHKYKYNMRWCMM